VVSLRSSSVVMPVRNAAAHIDEQFAALAAQTYTGTWELIVADNGSTDDTRARAEAWADRLPVHVVDASSRAGAGPARNRGVAASAGELLAFCDADDLVDPGWLAAHVRALDAADLVAGSIVPFVHGAPMPAHDPPRHAPTLLGWRAYAQGANCSVRRETFERVGGFREDQRYGEDVDFSWRAQIDGATFAYAPDAVVRKRVPAGTRALLRRYYRYGTCDVDLYERYRSEGVRRPPARDLARTYGGLIARLPALRSPEVRMRWASQAGRRAGRIVASTRRRIFFP
jgi:glycosyltransferase involved in cell wall biosynthesis